MRRLIPLALLLMAPMANAQDTDPLAQYVWISRLVLVFADTPQDPRFVHQLELLGADPAALTERDVVVLIDSDPAANGPLRQKLHPRDFMLVVIDKDGNLLFRKPVPWGLRELTRAIDKTPMRIDEINEKLGK